MLVSDPSGAAERLAAWAADAWITTNEALNGQHIKDLRAVLAELSRLREREQHFASVIGVPDGGQYRNDWTSRLELVLSDNQRLRAENERLRHEQDEDSTAGEAMYRDLVEALARIDAVLRLCDAQGEDSYVMVCALRAVLSSTGEPEAEAAP